MRRVWVAVAIYALLMSALGIDRYVIFRSGADLGTFAQAIANWSHALRNSTEGGSHFAYHFSPILYVAAPALVAFHSPLVLIILQACATAMVAPPLFLLARRVLPENAAVLVAIVALVYPPLVGVAFTDFHENSFAPATIVWLIWAVVNRRWTVAAIFVAVALAIKEDEAYNLAVLGVFYLGYAARRRDQAGLLFAAAATTISLLVVVGFFTFVRPLAGATDHWFAFDYFTQHDNAAQHGISAAYGRIGYLLEALAPLAFVPLCSRWFLLTLPGLFEVLSSHWSITYTMGQHYAAVWIGYMLVAFVYGIAAIAQTDAQRAIFWVRTSLALCALVLVFFSPTHWRHYLGKPTAHDAVLNRFIAALSADASIGTVDEIYAHTALDPNSQIALGGHPDFLLFDEHYDSSLWRSEYRPQLEALLRAGTYRAVKTADGVTLYQKVLP